MKVAIRNGQDASSLNRSLSDIGISWSRKPLVPLWWNRMDVHVRKWVFARSRYCSVTLCFAEINIAQEVKGKPSGPTHRRGF